MAATQVADDTWTVDWDTTGGAYPDGAYDIYATANKTTGTWDTAGPVNVTVENTPG